MRAYDTTRTSSPVLSTPARTRTAPMTRTSATPRPVRTSVIRVMRALCRAAAMVALSVLRASRVKRAVVRVLGCERLDQADLAERLRGMRGDRPFLAALLAGGLLHGAGGPLERHPQQRQRDEGDEEETPVDQREDDAAADEHRAMGQQVDPAGEEQIPDHVDVAHQADEQVAAVVTLVLGVIEPVDVREHVATNPHRRLAADRGDEQLEPLGARTPTARGWRERPRRTGRPDRDRSMPLRPSGLRWRRSVRRRDDRRPS